MTVSTVAVCCDDLGLMSDARRLCAAAGVEAEVTGSPDVRRWWSTASAVLLDTAAAVQVLAAGVPRRRAVALLARVDEPALWRVAVAVGVEQVAVIPQDERTLLAGVLGLREEDGGPPVVACVPATGGAGASTVAAGLALATARAGVSTLLVDADPDGGGLDLLFGLEGAVGLRWPDLLGPTEMPPLDALPEGLLRATPQLRVLSWGRGPGERAAAPSRWSRVLPAARSEVGLVVVDLPRSATLDDNDAVDVVLLVVRAGVRQTAAAARAAERLRTRGRDVRLVVRSGGRGGLRAAEIAAAVGLPLAGEIPDDARVVTATDEGQLPRLLGRFPFDALAHDLPALRRPAA